MDLSVDDCDARVFQYLQDFTCVVEESGLQSLIGTAGPTNPGNKDRLKKRCRLLVENLQPMLLQDQVQRLIEFERRDFRTNDVAFYDLILEHTKAQQRFFSQSKDSAAAAKRKAGVPALPAAAVAPKQPAPPPSSKQSKYTPGKRNSGGNRSTTVRVPKPYVPPAEGCLFCKGPHRLRECPTATEQQRRSALEQFRESKQLHADSIRLKAAGAGCTRYMARLYDVLEVPYLADTGADRSIIPSGALHALLHN